MKAAPEVKKYAAKIEKNEDLAQNPSIIKLYANSFQCGLTLGDGSIVLRQDDISICLIHMSIPAMKSLAMKLNEVLDTYSKDLNIEIDDFETMIGRAKSNKT